MRIGKANRGNCKQEGRRDALPSLSSAAVHVHAHVHGLKAISPMAARIAHVAAAARTVLGLCGVATRIRADIAARVVLNLKDGLVLHDEWGILVAFAVGLPGIAR